MEELTYYLFWFYTSASDDDFSLQVMNDSTYQYGVQSLTSGQAQWVIIHPPTAQKAYPRVDANTGNGYAYIGMIKALGLTLGNPIGIFWSEEYGGWVQAVNLTQGTTYTVSVTETAKNSADPSLYIFRMAPGPISEITASSMQDFQSSTNPGIGIDESITFTANFTDTYAIVTIRESGDNILGGSDQNPGYASVLEISVASE